MRFLKTVVTAALLVSGLHSATAGVVLGGTRVIYPESKKEVSLTVKNPDKGTDYLIQSWLDNGDDKNTAKVPFVVTPPLFRLDREKENVLRIARAGGSFPSDRESVYWLSVKAIAATQKDRPGNHLQITVRNRIKLFYRPAALTSQGAAEAYKSLTFTRQGNSLLIKNPTPYYVSFYSLKVGGKEVKDPGMVAPSAELKVNAPGSGAIEWQAVNDYGGYTATARQ